MSYSLLADLVVAMHVIYVGFVIFGEAAVLLGWAAGWSWVRNRWFRLSHLTAILIVAFEALARIDCPLTIWEDKLRTLAGQDVTGGTFIGRFMHNVLFYSGPPWVFTTAYIGFAVLVLLTLVTVPPRWRDRRRGAAAA